MSKNSNQNLSEDKSSQYILIGLTIVSALLAFLFWQKPLTVYDIAGHVSLVQTVVEFWPKLSGWSSSELLGWPAGVFYPSLFHWLAAGLSFLVGVPAAIKLLISTSIIVLPFSIYTFARSIFEDKLWAAFTTTGLFLLLLLFPNFLGTGFRALFEIGLLSNFFVLPLFFLFLASLHRKKSFVVSGLLLGVIVLTHIVAAIAAGIYLALLIKVRFLSRHMTRPGLVQTLKILRLAALLTAFFWFPFLFNIEYTSVSRHVSSYFLPNIAVFAISMLVGFYAWRKREENIFILAMFSAFITFVAAIDAYLIRTNGTSFFLYPFHIYRFQPFAYLVLATAVIVLASKLVKFDQWGFAKTGALFGGFGLIVLILLAKNPAVLPDSRLEITNPEGINGRFIETFRRTESDPYWYGAQTEVVAKNPKASWVYGLFTDSTPNGPYLGSLIKSLRPEAYPEVKEDFLETKTVDGKRLPGLLSHLGINYLVHLDNPKGEKIGSLRSTDGRITPVVAKNITAERVNNSSLFDIVRLPLEPIESNWSREVEKWWLAKGEITEIPYLKNGRELSEASKKDLQAAQVKIVDKNENGTSFQLDVKSDNPVPVLAKISYFPYWTAYDEGGKEIQIYRTAPNLMLFEAKGEVTLFYHEPGWIGWLWVISVGSFTVTIYLIFKPRKLAK